MTDNFTIDNPGEVTFTVDQERRIIKGLALPFGDVATSRGRKWTFSKGSLTWGKVKVLDGHDWSRAVGTADLEETDEGLQMTAKIARGARGDEVLSLAEDGVYDGLSIGLADDVKAVLKEGVYHATSGTIREVSTTPIPSFQRASVTSVAASAATDKEGARTMGDEQNTETPEAPDFSAVTDAIKDGFANLQFPQRETVSAGGSASTEVNEEMPYRFDGIPGAHSFTDDIRAAYTGGDNEARQRLETFMEEAFAVTTTNVTNLNPTQNRPELYVPNLSFTRPLWELVSTGSVTDKTPFTVPKFSSASGLVGDHAEGVEPTPGAFAATSQTVSPAPLSGKIEINREVWDQGGSPQADGIIWGEMLNGWFEAIEAKIAARLKTTATAELNLGGAVDAPLSAALTNYLAGLQFVRGGNRFTAFAADAKLFPALVAAKDGSNRPLFPVIGPANADGTVSGGFDRVSIGAQQVRAAWALSQGTNTMSFNFVPSSVWAWASAPKRFTFEYQVKSIDMAIWGYCGTAILRDSDVKPIDYDVSDA